MQRTAMNTAVKNHYIPGKVWWFLRISTLAQPFYFWVYTQGIESWDSRTATLFTIARRWKESSVHRNMNFKKSMHECYTHTVEYYSALK
jgi:hypothetical protein